MTEENKWDFQMDIIRLLYSKEPRNVFTKMEEFSRNLIEFSCFKESIQKRLLQYILDYFSGKRVGACQVLRLTEKPLIICTVYRNVFLQFQLV